MAAPRPGAEPGVELANGALQIFDDERDLERGEARERADHHGRGLSQVVVFVSRQAYRTG
jgi:hypothetical protein